VPPGPLSRGQRNRPLSDSYNRFGLCDSLVAKRSRRPTPAHAARRRGTSARRRKRSRRRSWADPRRPGDYERLGNAGCASSLESESIPRKRSRISEGPPPGACWPALDQLTYGRAGFCNRRGAAVWSAPARRLLRLLRCSSALETAAGRSKGERSVADTPTCNTSDWRSLT
jgi:hypothetical protein